MHDQYGLGSALPQEPISDDAYLADIELLVREHAALAALPAVSLPSAPHCLVESHICSPSGEKEKNEQIVGEAHYAVTIYQGGRLATVKPLLPKVESRPVGSTLWPCEGARAFMGWDEDGSPIYKEGYEWRKSRRGVVRPFSKGSRIRCLQKTAELDMRVTPLPLFVTLTYHNEWPDDRRCKAQLRAFRWRFEREFGKFPWLWRLDWQKRGAPHFHLLCFGLFTAQERLLIAQWVGRTWNELVAPGDAEHLQQALMPDACKQVDDSRAVMAYVGHYIGKVPEVAEDSAPGRQGGVWNWRLAAVSKRVQVVSSVQGVKVRRALGRLRRPGRGSYRPRASRYWGGWAFVGSELASKLMAWLANVEHGYAEGDGYAAWDTWLLGRAVELKAA